MVKQDEAPDPVDVSALGAPAAMAKAECVTHLLEQPRLRAGGRSLHVHLTPRWTESAAEAGASPNNLRHDLHVRSLPPAAFHAERPTETLQPEARRRLRGSPRAAKSAENALLRSVPGWMIDCEGRQLALSNMS